MLLMEKTIASLYALLDSELIFLMETSCGQDRPLKSSARGSVAVGKTNWMSWGIGREPGRAQLCPPTPCNGAPLPENETISSDATWTAAGSSI